MKNQESIMGGNRKQEDIPHITNNKKEALDKVVDMKPEDFSQSAITKKEARAKVVEMYAKALDDLVNVNSLFTMAVFIGLSFATPNQRSLEDKRQCDPDPVLAKNLVLYEVLSFSFFLVSSLAAKTLKVLLNIHKLKNEFKVKFVARIQFALLGKMFTSKLWRRTIFLISSAASSLGVFFLTLSMFNVIQIRLGKFSCGSAYTLKSVISLAVLVLSALMLYLPPMIYAALANFKNLVKVKPEDDVTEVMSGVL